MPLFVCPKETVYAPYPSLLCAHLHFLRISAHCLLSLCILPINCSAQSRPPTEAMSPPPQRRESDRSAVLVTFIQTIGKWEHGCFLSHRGNCTRQRVEKSRVREKLHQQLQTFSYHPYHLLPSRLSHIASPCVCVSSALFLLDPRCPRCFFKNTHTLSLLLLVFCWYIVVVEFSFGINVYNTNTLLNWHWYFLPLNVQVE